MTTVELLALTVLRTPHDRAAIDALLDLVLEDRRADGAELAARPLFPTHRLPADRGRLRAVVYLREGYEVGREGMVQIQRAVGEWLRGGMDEHRVMVVNGVDRIEPFELPEGAGASPEEPTLRQLVDKVRASERRRLPKP